MLVLLTAVGTRAHLFHQLVDNILLLSLQPALQVNLLLDQLRRYKQQCFISTKRFTQADTVSDM